MEIYKYIVVFLSAFLVLVLLDYIWLWHVTKNFIIKEFWDMVVVENGKIKIQLWVWLTAWAIISSMIVIFVTLQFNSYKEVLIYWALLWAMSYAMYDLTNLTFLNNYSLKFTLVDIAWWTFVWTAVAGVSYYVMQIIK